MAWKIVGSDLYMAEEDFGVILPTKSGSTWSLQADVSTVFDPNKQYVHG